MKTKKKGIVWALVLSFAALFLFYGTFATGKPLFGNELDMTVIKLSGTTNAHAERYDQSSYNILLRFDSIFYDRVPPSNPHPASCSEGNGLVLKLSENTNAHAEAPEQTNYNVNVCYSSLSCTAKTGSCNTASGERCVVKLSGSTDAHLETCENSNYPISICCTSSAPLSGTTDTDGDRMPDAWETNFGFNINDPADALLDADADGLNNLDEYLNGTIPRVNDTDGDGFSDGIEVSQGFDPNDPNSHPASGAGEITRVYWADNSGSEIPDANNDGKIDFIKYAGNTLKLTALTTLPAGQMVLFDIKEDDSIVNDDIKNGLDAQTDSSGKAVYSWTISNVDMDLGGVGGALEGDILEFYFTSKTTSGASDTSKILEVKNEIGPNTPPIAIIDPALANTFISGQPITFRHQSIDAEGPITVEWYFGDGSGKSSLNEVLHTYTLSATESSKAFVITLTATDEEGANDIASATITIINPNVAGIVPVPIINKPLDGEANLGKIVSYRGDSSYAVDIRTSPSLKIVCAGGNCPATIGSVAITNDDNKKGIFSDMNFKWTFGADDSTAVDEGDGKTAGVKIYKTAGNNKEIKLALTISGVTKIATNHFDILSDNRCSASGDYYTDSRGVVYSTSTPGVCSLASPACCPSGSACSGGSGGSGSVCLAERCSEFYIDSDGDDNAITSCNDYNKVAGSSSEKQFQCENDCNSVGTNIDNPEYIAAEGRLGQISSSGCEWVSSTNKCVFDASLQNGGDGGEVISCTYEASEDSGCVNGEQTITWIDSCNLENPVTETFSCKKSTIQLPFFGMLNTLAVIMILGLAYLLMARKRISSLKEALKKK